MTTDDTMDFEMDVDMDADVDPELAAMQKAAAELHARPSMAADADNETMNGVQAETETEDGEVSQAEIAATKVHIEGLAEMNTQDVENFARDHFPSDAFRRVEWVNDYSANLVYDTPEAAADALRTLAAAQVEDPLELRPAKASITHPQADLSIRQAVVTDQKVKNAAVQSAFYLMHPEYDPENRPGRGRGGRGRGGRPRRGGGYGRHERPRSTRSPTVEKPFDVNLYDDDPASVAARQGPNERVHKVSNTLDDRASDRWSTRGEDLIINRSDGRLKDRSRSRSPAREGDGRFGFSDDQPYRQTARRRSPPPPRRRLSNENRLASEKMKSELFPGKKSSASLELKGHDKSSSDLFPHKSTSGRNARDNDRASEKPRDLFQRIKDSKPRDLFARNETSLQAGRLNADLKATSNGFSIKGAGAKNETISFLGASKERQDLFSSRIAAGGGGGDLFPEKVRRRKGASDFI
ncbi:uncharacterized protein SEPMUDRAFT_121086 [Sphaerulina musiva SO2202]|uniref:Uncharacterized protein n=1 Tax=Sphaerulina musiva (strain SO2202) TaxID=692275 RepID=M3C8T9_SPHMS|nr:uncharacterized protein SEPMUDRAFT_121086 [Sphaerulina musiva SO2202]EMF08290.1 hypothetical protein SEPMUDRAFT_121086 [Sphaerulina musiva SO2202]